MIAHLKLQLQDSAYSVKQTKSRDSNSMMAAT